jgi:hypothetical protein
MSPYKADFTGPLIEEKRVIEGLPIPLQQGDNDASSLLQALLVLSKTLLETCLVLDYDLISTL